MACRLLFTASRLNVLVQPENVWSTCCSFDEQAMNLAAHLKLRHSITTRTCKRRGGARLVSRVNEWVDFHFRDKRWSSRDGKVVAATMTSGGYFIRS